MLRACLKIPRGAVFAQEAGWRGASSPEVLQAGGATMENTPCGSSTEKQRSQTAFSAKTLRAAGLLSLAGVGSVVTARCGDAPTSPPWPNPKSLAAALLAIFRQALSLEKCFRTFLSPAQAHSLTRPPATLSHPMGEGQRRRIVLRLTEIQATGSAGRSIESPGA